MVCDERMGVGDESVAKLLDKSYLLPALSHKDAHVMDGFNPSSQLSTFTNLLISDNTSDNSKSCYPSGGYDVTFMVHTEIPVDEMKKDYYKKHFVYPTARRVYRDATIIAVTALINGEEVRVFRPPSSSSSSSYLTSLSNQDGKEEQAMNDPIEELYAVVNNKERCNSVDWKTPSSGWLSELNLLLSHARWIYAWDAEHAYALLRYPIRSEDLIQSWFQKTRDPFDDTRSTVVRLVPESKFGGMRLIDFAHWNGMDGDIPSESEFSTLVLSGNMGAAERIALQLLFTVARICRICWEGPINVYCELKQDIKAKVAKAREAKILSARGAPKSKAAPSRGRGRGRGRGRAIKGDADRMRSFMSDEEREAEQSGSRAKSAAMHAAAHRLYVRLAVQWCPLPS